MLDKERVKEAETNVNGYIKDGLLKEKDLDENILIYLEKTLKKV